MQRAGSSGGGGLSVSKRAGDKSVQRRSLGSWGGQARDQAGGNLTEDDGGKLLRLGSNLRGIPDSGEALPRFLQPTKSSLARSSKDEEDSTTDVLKLWAESGSLESPKPDPNQKRASRRSTGTDNPLRQEHTSSPTFGRRNRAPSKLQAIPFADGGTLEVTDAPGVGVHSNSETGDTSPFALVVSATEPDATPVETMPEVRAMDSSATVQESLFLSSRKSEQPTVVDKDNTSNSNTQTASPANDIAEVMTTAPSAQVQVDSTARQVDGLPKSEDSTLSPPPNTAQNSSNANEPALTCFDDAHETEQPPPKSKPEFDQPIRNDLSQGLEEPDATEPELTISVDEPAVTANEQSPLPFDKPEPRAAAHVPHEPEDSGDDNDHDTKQPIDLVVDFCVTLDSNRGDAQPATAEPLSPVVSGNFKTQVRTEDHDSNYLHNNDDDNCSEAPSTHRPSSPTTPKGNMIATATSNHDDNDDNQNNTGNHANSSPTLQQTALSRIPRASAEDDDHDCGDNAGDHADQNNLGTNDAEIDHSKSNRAGKNSESDSHNENHSSKADQNATQEMEGNNPDKRRLSLQVKPSSTPTLSARARRQQAHTSTSNSALTANLGHIGLSREAELEYLCGPTQHHMLSNHKQEDQAKVRRYGHVTYTADDAVHRAGNGQGRALEAYKKRKHVASNQNKGVGWAGKVSSWFKGNALPQKD